MRKITFSLFFLGLTLSAINLFAGEILGSAESEIKDWASQHGYTVQDTNRGSEGCRKGKQYVQLSGNGVKVYALFFQPLYQEHSQKVTQVEFEPTSPVPYAKAHAWAVQVAPIVGTRPGTHKQEIEAGKDPCSPPNGGFEERYTGDYLVEYHYAPGKSLIERVKVANEGIR